MRYGRSTDTSGKTPDCAWGGANGLATLDPDAGEEEWLAFELAVAVFGAPAGYIDLEAARSRLGADGAQRMVARAAAICARRGVGLLVGSAGPAPVWPLRRTSGPRPPGAGSPRGRREPLARRAGLG